MFNPLTLVNRKIRRKRQKTFEFYFSDQWRDSESKLMDMNTRHCVITLASVIILFLSHPVYPGHSDPGHETGVNTGVIS